MARRIQPTGRVDSDDIRASLDIYPDSRFNIFRFLLESVTLTVEVFLHRRIGSTYLSIPKAFFGSLFLFVVIFVPVSGLSIPLEFKPTHVGGVSLIESVVKALFGFDWKGAFQTIGQTIDNLRDPNVRDDFLKPILNLVACYSVAVNLHLIANFAARHSTPPVLWHPRSSGNPWKLWNWVYRLAFYYNVQIDVVKQLIEPACCFAIACLLNNRPWTLQHFNFALPWEYQFVIPWLKLGTFALALRAYLENRKKYRLAQERLAGELDAKAFELQDQLYRRDDTGEEFVEAVGKGS